eukprot:m.9399 g.9399  ORF g.9399 m.9399 type:complete len:644 (-) comp5447_c0_seq1:169-2100(-)
MHCVVLTVVSGILFTIKGSTCQPFGMDQVDNIIFLTMRQLGANVPEEITSMADTPTDTFIEWCGTCVNTINGNEEMPLKLPGSMAARFRVGTTLADACQKLGYGAEIGYNSFLYSNENDSRQLLMWLIERLPAASSSAGNEALGNSALFEAAMGQAFKQQLSVPWIPPAFHTDGVCWVDGFKRWHLVNTSDVAPIKTTPLERVDMSSANAESIKYEQETLPPMLAQTLSQRQAPMSILHQHALSQSREAAKVQEWDTQGMASGLSKQAYAEKKKADIQKLIASKLRRGVASAAAQQPDMPTFLSKFAGLEVGGQSRFRNREQLQFADGAGDATVVVGASEEEIKQQREQELADMTSICDELQGSLRNAEAAVQKLQRGEDDMQKKIAMLLEANQQLQKALKTRKRVLDLLDDPENNAELLQQAIDELARKLMEIGAKWEESRTQLIAELRSLKAAAADQASDARVMSDEVKAMREEMEELVAAGRERDALAAQLEEQHSKLNSTITRSAYSSRVLDVIKSIDKQKQEVTKVLIETRGLQKDISQLESKLERSFQRADDLIFKSCKDSDGARKAYHLLCAVHESCGILVQSVHETGTVMQEARALEDKIDVERRRDMMSKVKKINRDLKEIKKENEQLRMSLKQ